MEIPSGASCERLIILLGENFLGDSAKNRTGDLPVPDDDGLGSQPPQPTDVPLHRRPKIPNR